MVTVRNMSGEVAWGPSPTHPSEHVSALQEQVAKVTLKPKHALLLLQGDTMLRPDSTLLVNEAEDCVELTMSVASPDHLLDTAVKALDACPRDEERWVPRPGLDEPWQEHSNWLQGGARVVQEQIEVLGKETAGCPEYKRALCNFVLKVLDVPGSEGGVWGLRPFRNDHGYDARPPPELYPEDLTWTAANMLPKIVNTADTEMHRIIVEWLQRRTSSYWTLNEVIYNVPILLSDVDRTTRRSALRELLGRANSMIRSLPEVWVGNWQTWGTPGSPKRLECTRKLQKVVESCYLKEVVENIEIAEYTIVSCYWAIVGLWKDEDAGMVLDAFLKEHATCNQKYKEHDTRQTWGDFFSIHPELNMHPWEMPQKEKA